MTRTDNLAPVRLEVIEGPKRVSVETAREREVSTDEEGWRHYAYSVRLTRGDESLVTPWRQGTAHTDEPTAADVLGSILMDVAGYMNARDFEDWARDYGLDTDSRKAEAMYRTIGEQAKQLRHLLGGEDFEAAINPPIEEDHEDVAKRLTQENA